MPVYPKPDILPAWTKPENASVLDPWYRAPLRTMVSLLGLDDPQQIMALGVPLETGAMTGGVVDALAAKFPRVAQVIKAYHGSPHDFDAFDIAKAGTTTDAGRMGRAVYFATDPNVAASFPHRYEVGIAADRPLNVSLPSWEADKTKLVTDALGLPADASPDTITRAARAAGFDHVALDYAPVGYKHKELAVFDPATVEILKKYGIVLPVVGLGAAEATKGNAQ